MSNVTRFQVLRGTTTQRTAITPLISELVFDTDLNKMYVGDGSTAGGLEIGTSLTQEQVEDFVGALIGDSTTIDVTYNDAGNVETMDVIQTALDHTNFMNIGTNSHSSIDSHIASTANPHAVTKTQVGLGNVDNTSDVNKPVSTAQQTEIDTKNENIQFRDEGTALGTAGTVDEIDFVGAGVTATRAANKVTVTVGAGGGEANTASNVGTAGVGVFKQKTGVDLEFKKINAGSSKVTITDDTGNSEVDIDVAEENIVHQNLSGAGTNTHAQIDTHIASTSNPHAVTIAQVSPLTTKGDLLGYSTVNARVPIGANNKVLMADSTQALGLKWANAMPDPLVNSYYFDDFWSSLYLNNWKEQKNGTGAKSLADNTYGNNNHPGNVVFETGTTATNYANFGLGDAKTGIILGGGILTYRTAVYIPTLSSGTEEFILEVGAGDQKTTSEHANGVYFMYDRATNVNWLVKTANTSTRTSTDSGVAVAAGSWIHLAFVVNAAATSVEYFINGTSVGTITTNIPTVFIDWFYKFRKTVGTTNRLFALDFHFHNVDFTSSR